MSSDLDYEEQKLLRRKKKSSEAGNLQQLAEVCLRLGELYNDRGEYLKALNEFKLVAKAYNKLKMAMEVGRANRMVGEMFMLLGEYEKALQYETIYLDIARREEDKTELQRAYVTIGRAHLLKGQSCDKAAKESFDEAEKAFLKSLKLSRELNRLSKVEQMDMEARSFLNLGVTKEMQGDLDNAVKYIQEAIKIAQNNDLHKLLHQCYISASLLLLKQKNQTKALKILSEALEVASRLQNKSTKMCETLLIKNDVMIRMGDFQSARQTLKQAYRLKTPVVSDAENIESQLKVLVALCRIEDKLITVDSSDHATKKRLYEQMGDGSCKLENYGKGIDYYLKMLECAQLKGETERELIPIYVSLYQTYKDNKQYEDALVYLWKEYNLIEKVPKEAFNTLLNIAEVYEMQNRSCFDIEDIYRRARQEAKKLKSLKLERIPLQRCIALLKKHGMELMAENLEKEAEQAGIDLALDEDAESDDDVDHDETETSVEFLINTEEIGDDVDLAELSNSENESEKPGEGQSDTRATRKRGTSFKVRRNGKGETQLHQACINGNTVLVQKLLDQGHPVNVRDNAGWLPLHEACIYGHKDIVDMLVDRGAHINDKGGVKCDGITPLYDACSNGNLEVVELLLDRGANCTLRTDSGDTTLNILEAWFAENQKLLQSDHIAHYNNVRDRIQVCFDKAGIKPDQSASLPEALDAGPSTSEGGRSSRRRTNRLDQSRTEAEKANAHLVQPNKKTKATRNRQSSENCESPGKRQSSGNRQPSGSRQRDTRSLSSHLSSDSADESKEENTVSSFAESSRSSLPGLDDYRSAIQVLRKGSTVRAQIVAPLKDPNPGPAKRSAYMERDEVGDDWLENDIGPVSKRQKFFSDKDYTETNLRNTPNRPAKRSLEREVTPPPDPPISDETITTSGLEYDSDGDCEDIGEVTLEESEPAVADAHEILMSASEKSFSRKSSSQKSERRPSSAGSPRNQVSLLDAGFSVSSRSSSPSVGQPAEEPRTPEKDGESSIESRSPVKVLPPSMVRVVVEGEPIDVTYDEGQVMELNVGWLVNEAGQRYGVIHGKRPLLKLLRQDGGLCVDSDPLTTLLDSDDTTVINSYVIEYQQLRADQFYEDYCKYREEEFLTEMATVLDKMESMGVLDVGRSFFKRKPIQWDILFEALEKQGCVRILNLSNNQLSDDDFQLLTSKLPTLRQLETINLSANLISPIGLSCLTVANLEVLTRLTELDLSGNPLSDNSLSLLTTVLQKLEHLTTLRLSSTSLTNLTIATPPMDIHRLRVFDVSDNDLNKRSIDYLFSALNTRILTELNLRSLGKLKEFKSMLILVFQSKYFDTLRVLNLSKCDLTDDDLSAILFALRTSADKLKVLDLSFNRKLTQKSFVEVFESFTSQSLDSVHFVQNPLVLNDWRDNMTDVIHYERDKCYPCRVELMVPLAMTVESKNALHSSLETFWSTIWKDRASVEMSRWKVTLACKAEL
ncbi:tonsoku-like protein [Sabethes cyaneus]|uniref:tonsoku-like protein n=1 Tax=Sabethes cyaneus TaxID=53552 RepID=UPI00237E6A80|nr:tonsoku-like protein [Sabethes cyaneus]